MSLKYVFVLWLAMAVPNAQNTKFDHDDAWFLNIDKALSNSKKENNNVLVYFSGSDWCGPCKMLKKDLFDTPEFQEISKNYTLLYVDIPRNKDLLSAKQYEHNKSLLATYNKRGVFPMIKILNSKGKELAEYSGYSMTGDISYHLNLLKEHQK